MSGLVPVALCAKMWKVAMTGDWQWVFREQVRASHSHMLVWQLCFKSRCSSIDVSLLILVEDFLLNNCYCISMEITQNKLNSASVLQGVNCNLSLIRVVSLAFVEWIAFKGIQGQRGCNFYLLKFVLERLDIWKFEFHADVFLAFPLRCRDKLHVLS